MILRSGEDSCLLVVSGWWLYQRCHGTSVHWLLYRREEHRVCTI